MRSIAGAMLALLIGGSGLHAQPRPPTPSSGASRPAAPAGVDPAKPQAPSTTPAADSQKPQTSLEQALYLIRSTMLTLNDANRSGNYTVLRDLASPEFQANNSAADLSVIFTDLRKRNFDLFSTALIAPQLSSQPTITENQMLRLTGFFPTRPKQINFDLLFQSVRGQWRLFGISVATPDAPQPQAVQTSPPSPGGPPAAAPAARQ